MPSRFRRPEDVDPLRWDALATWLHARGHTVTLPDGPRQFAGGLGNWNYLVELDGAPHVLRRPPAGPLPVGANDMTREHRILGRLNSHFSLAPYAPVFCGDDTVIGAPFLLIEYRDGVVLRDVLPADATLPLRGRLATQLVDVLARLHALEPRDVGLQDLGRPEGMVARQAKNWTLRARNAFDGHLPPALAAVAGWLDRPAPLPQRTSLLHSDYKLDNLILAPRTLEPVALIDWDMGTLGDPLMDLATLLSYWAEPGDHPAMLALGQMPTAVAGFPSRAQVLQMYARRSGLALDQFRYYRVLALFRLCVVFQQLVRRHQRSGRKDARAASFPALVAGLVDFTAHTLATEGN